MMQPRNTPSAGTVPDSSTVTTRHDAPPLEYAITDQSGATWRLRLAEDGEILARPEGSEPDGVEEIATETSAIPATEFRAAVHAAWGAPIWQLRGINPERIALIEEAFGPEDGTAEPDAPRHDAPAIDVAIAEAVRQSRECPDCGTPLLAGGCPDPHTALHDATEALREHDLAAAEALAERPALLAERDALRAKLDMAECEAHNLSATLDALRPLTEADQCEIRALRATVTELAAALVRAALESSPCCVCHTVTVRERRSGALYGVCDCVSDGWDLDDVSPETPIVAAARAALAKVPA